MNLFAFIDFINVILAVFLGTLIYTKDSSSKLNRVFLLNCILSAYTAACEYFRFTAPGEQWAYFWHKASFLWPLFPFAFLMFVVTLTDYRLNSKLKYLFLLPAFVISGLHVFSDLLYKDFVHEWYGWIFTINMGLSSAIVPLYIILPGLVSFTILGRYYFRSDDPEKRKQVVFTFLGMSIPYLAGVVSGSILRGLGFNIAPLNALSFLLANVFFSVSILRYKTFLSDALNTVKQVFATTEDYLLVFDQKHKIILSSRSFLSYTGYIESEVRGKMLDYFFRDQNGLLFKDPAEKMGKEIELFLRTKSETEIPTSVGISIIDKSNLKGTLYLLWARDLTERKRYEAEIIGLHKSLEEKIKIRTSELASINLDLKNEINVRLNVEKVLRESEERYRHLFENSPIGIYRTTPAGQILLANPALVSMLGYDSFEQLMEINLDREGFSEATPRSSFKKLLDENSVLIGYEEIWFKKDGTPIYCLENAKAVRDRNGEILCYEGTVENITRQKLADEALQESEQKYRTLIDTANEGVLILGPDNMITFVNSKMTEMLHCDSGDLLGNSIEQFVLSEDLPVLKQHFQDRRIGIKKSYEWRFRRKDNVTVWVIVSGTPIFDERDNFQGSFAMLTDITERKKAEKEIEEYWLYLEDLVKKRTEQFEEVNLLLQNEIVKRQKSEEIVSAALEKEKELSELKSRFISMTSHEFRTPLTTVLSSTELLERYGRSWDEESYCKQTERIKRSILYLTNLIDDVLVISRTDTGKISFEPRLQELEKICLYILDEIKPLVTEKNKILFNFNSELKMFNLDEKLIKLIIMNLLSNAIKYSPDGGNIYFDVTCENNNLIMEIADEGIGIPTEDQLRLFEPFNRGTNVGNIHGTGLGMSIVKRSVDIHKGSISFESSIGVGTKFCVKIPVNLSI